MGGRCPPVSGWTVDEGRRRALQRVGPEREQPRVEVGLQTEGPESVIRVEERRGSEGVRGGLNIRATFVYKQTNKQTCCKEQSESFHCVLLVSEAASFSLLCICLVAAGGPALPVKGWVAASRESLISGFSCLRHCLSASITRPISHVPSSLHF